MKKLIIISALILLLSSSVWATTYYVTQSGAGSHDGSSVGNAYSVAEHNAASFSANDVIYFSGTITSTVTPPSSGTSGNPIIYDGYETDDTTYQNISEAAGRAKIDMTTSDTCLDIDGPDYITIQDFEITDCSQAVRVGLNTESNDIILKRNFIYQNHNGLYVGTTSYNITIGGSSGEGNVFKNNGNSTAHEDIALAGGIWHDVIVSYNHLYADSASWGIDGIVTVSDGYDLLIEYNSIHGHNHSTAQGENGIDLKRTPYNIVIRFNHIYNHQYAFDVIFNGNSTNSVDKVYLYGNSIHDGGEAAIGFQFEDSQSYDEIFIFSDLIYNYPERGISNASWGHGTLDYSDGLFIFNCTFAENGNSGNDEFDTHIYSNAGWMTVKNNIFIQGSSATYSYRQQNLTQYADTYSQSDYNLYYYPSQTIYIDWGDAGLLSLSGIKAGSGNGLPQETNSPSEQDPGLVDWDNGDFTISSESSAVAGAGTDMGSGNIVSLTINGETVDVPWDFALGPNTDWSGTIPVIEKLARDTYGWDQGAYVFGSEQSHQGVSFQ